MSLGVSLSAGDVDRQLAAFLRSVEQQTATAALKATERAATRAKAAIRREMDGAGLGRLGKAVDANSDQSKGRGVHRTGDGFSASGAVFLRSRSERTLGAVEAYAHGATIRPVRSRLLWIPSEAIQRVAGGGAKKRRLTPANWVALGMNSKLGPLVRITASDGTPLLI